MGDFYHEDNFGSGNRLPETHKKGCLFCSYVDKEPRFLISKNEKGFSIVYGMQEKGLVLSKGQCLVISREHRENFSELTKEEWKTQLPLIKNAIGKISRTYHPVGFDVFSSLNKEGGQSHFHSHIHIIPKHKKDYGYCRRKWDLSLTYQDYKEIEEKLQTEQGIIKENDKAVAELVPFGKQAGKSHIIIRPKKSIPNDIEKLDKETWSEMWELMKESVKRCKENLGAKGFWWHTPLGEMTDVDQTSRSEFQIDIMPRWNVPTMEERHGGKTRSIPENERIAKKLNQNNNNNNYSLLELLREQKKKKNRPLKVVCDWDECIQPLKAAAIFEFYKGKLTFQEFFKLFWENAVLEGSFSSGGKINISLDTKEEKEAIEKYMEMRKEIRDNFEDYAKSFHGSTKRWETPLTSIGKDLLTALKEDLVEKLVVISSFRKNKPNSVDEKRKKVQKTFGLFPQCELEFTEVSSSNGKYKPYRWEVLRDKYPDFDIFIDDNYHIMETVIENHPTDKIYVLPDYKTNELIQGNNVYHVKTEISDLKDEDFAKAAQEIKDKKSQQSQPNPEPKNYWPWIIYGILVGIVLVLLFVLYAAVRKVKKTMKKRV